MTGMEHAIEQAAKLLTEHPSIPNFGDGSRYVCPTCGDTDVAGPNSPSHAAHQARALHQAGLLAASAVTRDEVWRIVAAHDPGDDEMALCRVNRLTDAVWSLVSGSDPAVFVVRESDVAAVEVRRDGVNWSTHRTCTPSIGGTVEDIRRTISDSLQEVVECEAVARAIEAEPADPVEAKARELCALAYPAHEWGNAPWDVAEHYEGIEAAFRRLACHQLGEEAGGQ